MSDDWLKNGLPVYHGGKDRTGARGEIDKLGGPQGFKTAYRDNLDGSTTITQLKGDMPPQIRTEGTTTPPVTVAPYMESGQLGWSYAPAESPLLGDPAKWYFLDIPPGGEWLGKIAGKTPAPGAQRNSPTLSEAMDSLAVGYPRKADPAADAASKTAYLSTTAMKKLVLGFFPSSLFSGKMRLFMQALYGAKATTSFPLSTDGASVIYSANGADVTLGHNTTGVFSAPDDTWWLLQIAAAGGTGGYSVTAWQIKPNLIGKALLKIYKSGIVSGLDKTKLEAYIFAHSTIDTANPKSVGAYAGAQGSPLAYGWKWNTDGSKASIVVHEVLGTGAADLRWFSSTMHLTFAYSAGNLSVTGSTAANGEWIDGWGEYNIFVPENELSSAPLICKSLRFNFGSYKTPLLFGGVAVYGYYIDDVWTPVTLSSTGNVPGPVWTHWSTNLVRDPTIPLNPGYVGQNYFLNCYVPGSISCSLGWKSETNSSGMSVSFAGSTTLGHISTVSLTEVIGTSGGNPFIDPTAWSAGLDGLLTLAVGASDDSPGWGGGYAMDSKVGPAVGQTAAYAWINGRLPAGSRWTMGRAVHAYSRTQMEITGTDYSVWALVIPGLDAEALYVTSYQYIQPNGGGTYHQYKAQMGYGSLPVGFTNKFTPEEIALGADGYAGWWNITGPFASIWQEPAHGVAAWDTQTYVLASGPTLQQTNVLCFNSAISGAEGVPGGSYYALYNCSKFYPYYDRGMWMMTSNGKRYVGSELPAAPASVEKRPFVGWA